MRLLCFLACRGLKLIDEKYSIVDTYNELALFPIPSVVDITIAFVIQGDIGQHETEHSAKVRFIDRDAKELASTRVQFIFPKSKIYEPVFIGGIPLRVGFPYAGEYQL